MQTITDDLIRRAAEILGTEDLGEDEIKSRLLAIADNNDSLARRLREWVPEAFGRMMVSRLAPVDHGSTFAVRDHHGKWIQIPNCEEPILEIATRVAEDMFVRGPCEIHQSVAMKSAALRTVNEMLHRGVSIFGGGESNTSCVGLTVKDYPSYKPPFDWSGFSATDLSTHPAL